MADIEIGSVRLFDSATGEVVVRGPIDLEKDNPPEGCFFETWTGDKWEQYIPPTDQQRLTNAMAFLDAARDEIEELIDE